MIGFDLSPTAEPVAAIIIWAMLILGERFSPWVWAALGVMLLGLFLVQPRDHVAKAA